MSYAMRVWRWRWSLGDGIQTLLVIGESSALDVEALKVCAWIVLDGDDLLGPVSVHIVAVFEAIVLRAYGIRLVANGGISVDGRLTCSGLDDFFDRFVVTVNIAVGR